MQKCIALIVAAGRGSRFGEGMPKQYHVLAQDMVLTRTVKAYLTHPLISAVKVVIHADDTELYEKAVQGLPVLPYCIGGKQRQDSVRLGLESLQNENPDIVLIHDAARPFIAVKTITDVIGKIKQGQGAIAAVPVTDTIKRVNDNLESIETVNRSVLWKAQTPQGFMYSDILAAHEQAKGQALTDDAVVAEQYGIKVVMVQGLNSNIKITTLEDLEMANKQLSAGVTKTGFGYDVHAFCDGDAVILAGIKIPCGKKLLGHSDADVALHALTDALLGAIGMGDIGLHFPPSDNKWKDADSALFVKFAKEKVTAKGYHINNVDITIICEAPKVSKYRNEMVNNVADILGISPDDVNIKGTTTEHLGFTGRGEGIAATASVSISR